MIKQKLKHTALLFCAWLAALTLASFAFAQRAHSTEFGVIGFASEAGQLLVVQDIRGTCPERTHRAMLLDQRTHQAFVGCWTIDMVAHKLAFVFEDGDSSILSEDQFTWLKKPEAI